MTTGKYFIILFSGTFHERFLSITKTPLVFACALSLLVSKPEYHMQVNNSLFTDDLAPCVARCSANMALTVQAEQVPVIHKDVFSLP